MNQININNEKITNHLAKFQSNKIFIFNTKISTTKVFFKCLNAEKNFKIFIKKSYKINNIYKYVYLKKNKYLIFFDYKKIHVV